MRMGSRQVRRIALFVGFALLALSSSGCAALLIGGGVAAGGAAGYAYYKGNVPRDYPNDFEQTWKATNYALSDLGFPIVTVSKSFQRGTIESRTANGDKIVLLLEPSPARHAAPDITEATRVHIRVGLFGDQPLSERIHQHIEGYLLQAAGPVSAPPIPTLQQPVQVPGGPVQIPPNQAPPGWSSTGSNPRGDAKVPVSNVETTGALARPGSAVNAGTPVAPEYPLPSETTAPPLAPGGN
jgi:hypothetical protein